MMQIMENRPVAIHPAERIPREYITAMIANGLDGRHTPKQHALPCAQLCNLRHEDETEDIQEKRLEPVGVYCAVGV